MVAGMMMDRKNYGNDLEESATRRPGITEHKFFFFFFFFLNKKKKERKKTMDIYRRDLK